MTQPVIMWFRQDLRMADHAALSAAVAHGPIIPLYILDDETPGEWCMGGAARWWLHHSLSAIEKYLPMVLWRGRADHVIDQILQQTGAAAIYFTRDYAPWSDALERRVKAICDAHGASCHRHGGFLLHEPEAIRNGSGAPYKIYTPFSRACIAQGEPRAIRPKPTLSFADHKLIGDKLDAWKLLPTKPNWDVEFSHHWQPGEAGALARLVRFLDDQLQDYAEGRDYPAKPLTSGLAAHLHFGEISPLQIWHAARNAAAHAQGGKDAGVEKFLKELLWREFSYHLLAQFPAFPNQPFRTEFSDFPWVEDDEAFALWQKGQTGYPIVDAGMRELWATGSMHNRVRMIAASFLIKDLMIPWQSGLKWFWDTLVDADLAANAANWQWVAGCGADASPYYRIFNPVLQGEKFDPDGTYIKHWVPELRDVPQAFIHKPWELAQPPRQYPKRMVDHGVARDRALAAFKKIRSETP